jgi:hypothetical protein
MTRKEQLKADLFQKFKEFQSITEPGGSDAANEIVAEGLAECFDRAIDTGFDIDFRGEMTCEQINADQRQPGYIYTALDAGVLAGNPVLEVTPNTVVMWDGIRFKTVLRLIPPDYARIIEELLRNFKVDPYLSTLSSNPVQNRVVTNALNTEKSERISAIANEAEAREQADAALQEQINGITDTYETKADAKAKANAWGIGMRYQATNTLKFYRPNL